MHDYIGEASAATLGFIAGDVPGAVAGYKAYRRFSEYRRKSKVGPKKKSDVLRLRGGADEEQRTPTKRKSSFEYPTPSKTPKRQKKVYQNSTTSSSMPRTHRKPTRARRVHKRTVHKKARTHRHHNSSRSHPIRASGGLTAASGAKRLMKRKAGLHPKQPKAVRISRKLKKQIHEVMEGTKGTGYYQYDSFGVVYNNVINGNQFVGTLGNQTVDAVAGILFSPTQILDAASVLWNAKSSVGGYTPTAITITDTGNLQQGISKINVIKQWVTLRFRNNSQRNYYLNLYMCKSKRTGTVASPFIEWGNALSEDYTLGINVANIGVSQLGMTPYTSKSFMTNWNVETVKFALAPGEEVTHVIEGPAKTYNFEKFYSGLTLYPEQKTNVHLMIAAQTDIVSTTLAGKGRYAEGTSFVSGGGVLYQLDYHYKLECPDLAGVSLPAAYPGAVQLDLNNKRDAYYYFNDTTASAGAGVVTDVLEMNPAVVISPPE